MNEFPDVCDVCGGSLRNREDSRTLVCPLCAPRFFLRQPFPFDPDVLEEAATQIEIVEKSRPAAKSDVKWVFSGCSKKGGCSPAA